MPWRGGRGHVRFALEMLCGTSVPCRHSNALLRTMPGFLVACHLSGMPAITERLAQPRRGPSAPSPWQLAETRLVASVPLAEKVTVTRRSSERELQNRRISSPSTLRPIGPRAGAPQGGGGGHRTALGLDGGRRRSLRPLSMPSHRVCASLLWTVCGASFKLGPQAARALTKRHQRTRASSYH